MARPPAVGAGTRLIEVIQAADVEYANVQIERWIGIRRMERTGFGRMLIDSQGDSKGPLDVLYRSTYIQQRPVGMGSPHRQTVRLRPNPDRLVIPLGRTEALSELLRGQIMPVLGTGRVVE